MSYMCFVPEDAHTTEHMTMFWHRTKYDLGLMEKEQEVLTTYCPFDVVVYEHQDFLNIPIAVVAVPHHIHYLWQMLSGYNESEHAREIPFWVPHISKPRTGELRPILSRITMVRAEWRP